METIENEYKEVYFHEYCIKCKYRERSGQQEPCCYCMDEPLNLHSHKPVKFEEKENE